MKRIHILSIPILFIFLFLGNQIQSNGPDEETLGGDEPAHNSSVSVTNLTNNDWDISLTYSYNTSYCNCTNITAQNVSFNLVDQNGNRVLYSPNSTSGGQTDRLTEIGPGQNRTLNWTMRYTGSRSWHRNLQDPCSIFATCIGSGVDCGCDYTYSGSGLSARTAAIKNPATFSAADGADDNSITLTWTKGTDIPDFIHKYRIYIDGSPTYIQLNGDVRSWTHTGLPPGESHSYRLTTYFSTTTAGTHESGGRTDTGSTFSTNTAASDGEHANRTLIEWADLSKVADEVRIERSEVGSNDREELEILSGTARSYSDSEGIPGFPYTYYVTPLNEGTPFLTGTNDGYSKPNGSIKGTVKSKFGAGVSGVDVEVKLLSTIPDGGAAPPSVCDSTYCATTDISGFYEIKDIYYYTDAEFRIVPKKSGAVTHIFTPAESVRSLDEDVHALSNIDFVDQTVFTVNGHVNYPIPSHGDTCGVKGVDILVNGNSLGIKTNSDGFWQYVIQDEGVYTFEPEYLHHTILDANMDTATTLTIVGDQFGIDFTDVETDDLIVIARGGCQTPLGDYVKIRVTAKDDETCFDTTYVTDASGYLLIQDLPAREYSVEVDTIATMSSNVSNIMAQIGHMPIDIDLTVRDTGTTYVDGIKEIIVEAQADTLPDNTIIITPADTTYEQTTDTIVGVVEPLVRFIYRSPLVISIDWEAAGAVVTDCQNSAGENVMLMESGFSYTILINVNESLGNQCPIDTGFLKIYDQVSDRGDDFVRIPIKEGVAKYQIDAGQPVTAHNPSFHDHEKYFYIVPEVDLLEPMPATYWVLVTGTRTNPGSFISRTPEIPMIILHDPPGDNSYSFIEKGTSFKHFTRSEVLVGGDAGFYLDLLLGAKFLTPFSGNGFGTQIKFSATAGQDNFNRNGIETTITFTETFSTSDADNFSGHEGDVYIGAAFNNEFSLAEYLTFNQDSCKGIVDVIPTISAEDFATTFVYTEKHIKNSLIPTISFLAQKIIDSPGPITQDEIIEVNNLRADSVMWMNILEQNDLHRSQPAASFKENISFSAGAPISKVYTTDTVTSVSYQYNRFVNSSFALGMKVDNEAGIWLDSELGVMGNFRFSQDIDTGDDTTQTTSVGYILDDGDIGDFLSVDILTDTAYNVPAFHLKAGTTSCPNEEGSQSRDRVEIVIPNNELNNIPMDESANFIVNLTNTSDSRETREYHVRTVSTTNPDGAAIRLGGQLINNSPASFFLEHGQVFNINLEVKKGPLASNYERIGIMMYPPCEYELWQDNGDLVNVDTAYVTVRFESECSSVSLVRPVDGWLVNQNNNDILHVTFSGYDLGNENLEELVFQFKKEGQGYEDKDIVKRDSLIGPFYDIFFNVSDYEDGNYRMRAKAKCNNSKGYTYSSELKGIIDRKSLAPFGIPTPSDGFLQVGQEISVTYDKEINCALNYPTDITLVRTDNDSAINFSVQCSGDKLILMPDVPLTDITDLHGVEVTATANLLRDNFGNIQKYPVVWSFLVNVKPIFWDPENVYASAIEGDPAIVQGTLKNNALLSKAFSLEKADAPGVIDYPDWLTPLQTRGTVLSHGDYTVGFAVDSELLPGIYQGTVTADVEGQAVSMDVTFELLARPVNWSFDGNQYDNSMTVVTQFSLTSADAPLSTDTRDIIAAFVNGEIRGLANIEYIPELDTYAAFMTVFSNDPGGNNSEDINFRFWKALSGVEYSALETIDFQPEGIDGSPGSPLILHPEGILQVIPLEVGWNWISLNLDNSDLSREKVFQSIIYASSQNTVTIKDQALTSEYANTSGWNGNLPGVELGKGYLVHLSDHIDTLRIPGTIPTSPVQIDLEKDWNWIGFPELIPRPIDEILDSIDKKKGDLVKSQYAFSTYDSGIPGWLGNLKEFKPGGGYKINLVRSSTLVFRNPSEYKVTPGLYEFNMNVTAILDLDELNEPNAEDLIVGAFVDGYCQGVATVEYVQLLDEYRAMLLVLGNPELLGAEIEFRVLNEKTEVEYIGNAEVVNFSNDRIEGTIVEPYVLFDFDKTITINEGSNYELADCMPNPISNIGVIPFTLAEDGPAKLQLFNLNGQLVKTLLDADLTAGRHKVEISLGDIQKGIYFYMLDTPGFNATKKLVKN